MVEYAMILALIALAMLAALAPMAQRVVGMWNDSDQRVDAASNR